MIKIMYRPIILTIVILGVTLLAGCWDYQDVNKMSVLIAVGIDSFDNQIELCAEIAKLTTQIGTMEKSQTPSVFVDRVSGKDFEEARMIFNSRRPYPTFLGATRVVILCQDFARENIEPYINRINKLYEYRKTLLMVISREHPCDILNTTVEEALAVGFKIENTINTLSRSGAAIYPTIGDILTYLAIQEVGFVLPYIGVENELVQYLGLAIMKDSTIVDIVESTDSKGILYIKANNLNLIENIPINQSANNTFSFRITQKKRNISTEFKQEQILITINVVLNAQLQYQYFIETIPQSEIQHLEELLENKITGYMTDIIEKTQKDWESDIFQFALNFRAEHPDVYRKIDWSEMYPQAQVKCNVKVSITNQNAFDPNAEKEI